MSSSFTHLSTAEITDQGLRRVRNEDAIIRLPHSGVFCVADGIGGAEGGHEASATTVLALLDAFTRADQYTSSASFDFRKNLVREAMNNACQSIRRHGAECGYRESGTTAATMLFDVENPNRAAVLHAGDSRVYRFRDNKLHRLTKDHTIVVESGWPEQDAWAFGMRTIITRAVGVRPFVDLDETPVDVQHGDVFLLCTDGLTRMLPDRVISNLIIHYGTHDLDHLVRMLVREANNAGGRDNITVLLVRVDEIMRSVRVPPGLESPTSFFGKLIHAISKWFQPPRKRRTSTAIR